MKPLLITFAVFLSLYRPVYTNDELTLAVLPYLPVKDIMQKFTPLAWFLFRIAIMIIYVRSRKL